jgi:hypothetical protein
MPRRNAFDRLHKDGPHEAISTIPLAKEHKRDNRAWDRKHPVLSYFVPLPLNEQAKDVRAAILGLSQKHMTTISSVARELMKYSLAHIREGKLKMELRPVKLGRRKMSVTLVEGESWPEPQEVPQPVERGKKKDKIKNVYLGYRWGREVDTQIKALAGKTTSPGEVVVFLLRYGIDAYRRGDVRLKEETVVVSQKVSATW